VAHRACISSNRCCTHAWSTRARFSSTLSASTGSSSSTDDGQWLARSLLQHLPDEQHESCSSCTPPTRRTLVQPRATALPIRTVCARTHTRYVGSVSTTVCPHMSIRINAALWYARRIVLRTCASRLHSAVSRYTLAYTIFIAHAMCRYRVWRRSE
jgi:hypothetical protein